MIDYSPNYMWANNFASDTFTQILNLLNTTMKPLFFILAWPFCAISVEAAKSIATEKSIMPKVLPLKKNLLRN
jgi:hypothetical protein